MRNSQGKNWGLQIIEGPQCRREPAHKALAISLAFLLCFYSVPLPTVYAITEPLDSPTSEPPGVDPSSVEIDASPSPTSTDSTPLSASPTDDLSPSPSASPTINRPPVTVDDTYSVNEDEDLTFDPIELLNNDSDPDGDLISIYISGSFPTENGSVTLNADGTYTYTPDENFFGTDSFVYTIHDVSFIDDVLQESLEAVGIVTITVHSVNDDPDPGDVGPLTVDENSSGSIEVLSSASDVDGDTVSLSFVGSGNHGTAVDSGNGSITYTPDSGYYGSDTVTYTISDGNGGYTTASLNVVINEVNNPPVPEDDSYTFTWDASGDYTTGDVTANDNDPDGDGLFVTNFQGLTYGSITNNGLGTLTYNPSNSDFTGTETFQYKISDYRDESESWATITITINPAASPSPSPSASPSESPLITPLPTPSPSPSP